jgi:hypothetical protein
VRIVETKRILHLHLHRPTVNMILLYPQRDMLI